MKPYYRDDSVTLYHGDCLEITEWLDADVLVTDPPYGMAFRSGQRAERFDAIAGDEDVAARDAALDSWGTKPAAVFGTWRVPKPVSTRQVLVWHKRGAGFMGDIKTPFGTSHEEVYLLGQWQKRGVRRGSVLTTEGSPSALTNVAVTALPEPDHVEPGDEFENGRTDFALGDVQVFEDGEIHLFGASWYLSDIKSLAAALLAAAVVSEGETR